jgi:hypothetical protein
MRLLGLGVVMVGCTQTVATPPGPLAPLALVRTGRIPPGTAETTAARYQGHYEICAQAPFQPAMVDISWTAARRGEEGWIVEAVAKLVEAPDGLVVTVEPNVKVGGASLEANAPWVDLADLTLRCTRQRFRFPRYYEQSLLGLVQLKATGEASVDGAPWQPATTPAP